MTVLPNGGAGVLFQVMDTGPGLKGKHYRTLFDPAQEFGTWSQGEMGDGNDDNDSGDNDGASYTNIDHANDHFGGDTTTTTVFYWCFMTMLLADMWRRLDNGVH